MATPRRPRRFKRAAKAAGSVMRHPVKTIKHAYYQVTAKKQLTPREIQLAEQGKIIDIRRGKRVYGYDYRGSQLKLTVSDYHYTGHSNKNSSYSMTLIVARFYTEEGKLIEVITQRK